MKLLDGEKVLLRVPVRDLGSAEVVLTSHRVRLNSQAIGSAEVLSIMLDELASCGRIRISKPIFLAVEEAKNARYLKKECS